MGVSKKELEERRMKARELYEKGLNIKDIAKTMGVAISTVYNSLSIAGITLQKERGIDESNLSYADNRTPILERLIIDGKRYVDITPIFSPR